MFYFTVLWKRNKYVLKMGGGKITTQKLDRSAIDKVETKKEIPALVVDETAKEEGVTAKHLGKRTIEVTANVRGKMATKLYKETLSIDKSAKAIRKIAEDFWAEDGIYVKKEEIYQAICKATKGLAGIHIQAIY